VFATGITPGGGRDVKMQTDVVCTAQISISYVSPGRREDVRKENGD